MLSDRRPTDDCSSEQVRRLRAIQLAPKALPVRLRQFLLKWNSQLTNSFLVFGALRISQTHTIAAGLPRTMRVGATFVGLAWLMLALLLVDAAADSVDDAGDRAALFDLFNSTGGPAWKNAANWTSGASFCWWFAVKCACDGVSCRVTNLNLLANRMVGTLPPSIGNLQSMQTFAVDGNPQLGGPIPLSICTLTMLSALILGFCSFSSTIPPCIGDMTSLNRLDMPANALQGSIPPSFYRLANLTLADFSRNQLSGTISEDIGLLAPTLSSFFIVSNQIAGVIPQSIGLLSQLIQFRHVIWIALSVSILTVCRVSTHNSRFLQG